MLACVTCDRSVQEGIFDESFPVGILTIPVLLVAGGLLAALLVRAIARRADRRGPPGRGAVAPLVYAGALLGMGLGGFLDGILLHQVLQVHQMLSNQIPFTEYVGKSVNMFWDGMFHAGAWTLAAVGAWALWRCHGRPGLLRSGKVMLGAWILGWGLFNVMDSVVNHHLLRYHDLVERSASPGAWNLAFLLFGAFEIAGGGLLVRAALRRGAA